MGYGCRELSNQEKRVWVMGQSQAVNNYPLSDTMLLGLLEIRVTLSCFQSTVQTQHAPLTFCDGVFSSAEVGRNNVASKVNKEWTEESKQITRKPGRVGPFSGQPLSEKWKTKALEITRVKNIPLAYPVVQRTKMTGKKGKDWSWIKWEWRKSAIAFKNFFKYLKICLVLHS